LPNQEFGIGLGRKHFHGEGLRVRPHHVEGLGANGAGGAENGEGFFWNQFKD